MKAKNIFFTILSLFIMIALKGQSSSFPKVTEVKGLPVGAHAPFFSAEEADGSVFSLEKALEHNPVVLIFYRGAWCPYCNKHLSSIQDSLSLIREKGVTVIAVSPEKPEYLEKMAQKTGARFALLYDKNYDIARSYKVLFKPSSGQLFTYNTFLNANLKKTHSDDSQRLPVPATFIIDRNGIIIWRQFDPDYKNRSTVKDILENLPE